MIRKTFDILKARWAETLLICVLQVAMMLLTTELMQRWQLDKEPAVLPAPDWAVILLFIGFSGFTVIWHMLAIGFLKSSTLTGISPQQPLDLLRAGRPYLWRILVFEIWLYCLMFIGGQLLQTAGLGSVLLPQWLLHVGSAAAVLLFLKPLFLIPAFVIVLDLTIAQAFFRARRVSLKDMTPLLKPIVCCVAVVTILNVASSFIDVEGPLYYALTGINYLANVLNSLLMFMAAILWTAEVFLPSSLRAEQRSDDTEG